jgi:hypothetical protein
MTRAEIARLLKAAKSLDSFIKGDDNQTNAWEATLDKRMPFDFAKNLLILHYRTSDQTIRPVVFIRAWQGEMDLRKWRQGQDNPRRNPPASPETVRRFAEMARAAMERNKTFEISEDAL